ncbi:MAG TPA: gluconeogenesis factor YvcK family protein [candidate division Zixibacteria bacterium]|nr:gluconeogenesis factor YvcK family protein [candidate division Zixibacteria bacterium]
MARFRIPRWLYPGMHLKRWLLLVFMGITVLALGTAIFLVDFYRRLPPDSIIFLLTGAGLDRPIRAALVGLAGLLLTGIGVWGLMRSIVSPFIARGDSVMEVLYTKRYLARGPRIVAIGGGTGLSNLLRGLKGYSANITAIVAVADDGGSSGRLRQQLGIVPPGDIRNCIAALADAEPLMTQLMQYRFPPGSGLDDHAFGNLFIAAMTAVTGDFEEAVRESNRVLAVRGQVLPATSVPLNLGAVLASGRRLQGQVAISHAEEPISQVTIDPPDVRANPEALERILEADLIVIGPGSLFSSVLPNLLISDIRDALAAASGVRVYVCNVATQPGETGSFTAAQHLEALFAHVGDDLIDYALVNRNVHARRPEGWQGQPVALDERRLEELPVTIVEEDLVDVANAHRHDSAKLASALMRLHQEERTDRIRQRRVRRPTASAV